MPTDGDELPVIIDHLDVFVDKLLNRIADDSAKGCAALVSTIETAKKEYNKPIDSWLTGWVHQYTRLRGPEVAHAIKGMEAFPDSYTRLQEFKLLVGKGKWNEGSFNSYLFIQLIKSVPGYRPLEKELIHPVVIRVKKLIVDKIDAFMREYTANLKLIASREKEREETHQSSQKSLDNVVILNNLGAAQDSAIKNPAKIYFSLTFKNELWQFSWVDLAGKVYKLAPGDELFSLLVDKKIEDVEKVNSVHRKQIKKECVKARELFLDKVQLLINPKDPATQAELNNESLIAKGLSATFILRCQAKKYSLCWISTLGKINEVSLESYPQFKLWLDMQKTLGEEQFPQIKTYLLQVNTAKAISGMDDFKSELQARLSHKAKVVSPAPKVASVKRLDLGLFADIANCLEKRNGTKRIVPEESIPNAALPPKDPSTRLAPERYAALSKLFSHKPKEEPKSVDEPKSAIQPAS